MAQFQVTPEKLRTWEEELSGYCGEARSAFQASSEALSGLEGSFHCGSSEQIRERLRAIGEELEEAFSALQTQIEKLSAIAEDYAETERRNTDEPYGDG